jgi:hypothetical protein
MTSSFQRVKEEIEREELDGNRTIARRDSAAAGGVLELDLTIENDPVVVLVADVENEPEEVELTLVAVLVSD